MKTIKQVIYVGILLILAGRANCQTNELSIIKLKNFTAYEKGDRLSVKWATEGPVATNYFEVQRSEDGKMFRTIALVLGPDPQQQGNNYQYMEKVKEGVSKNALYRLCHVDENGMRQTTQIIELTK